MKISKIIQNTFFLVGTSLLTKAILFLLYIYVARSLGPDKYGLITSSTEYVSLFLIMATFGFQMASVKRFASNNETSLDIFNKILPLRLCFGLISFFLCIFFNFVLYKNSDNYNLIILLSIMVLFEPFENHYYTIFWAKQDLKYPSMAELCKVFVYVGVFFLLNSLFGIKVINLIIASIAGYLISLIIKTILAFKLYDYNIEMKFEKLFMKSFFQESFYFGIVSILYIYSLKVDIQMINILSGSAEVGFYSASWQIVNIGIVFVQSLSTALFPGSMQKMSNKDYREKLSKSINVLTFAVCVICLITSISSSFFIKIIYGNTYTLSPTILSILIWYIPMRLFSIKGGQILEGGVWYKKRIFVYCTPLIINIILNIFTIPEYGALGAAVVSLISNFVLMSFIVILSKKYEKRFYN